MSAAEATQPAAPAKSAEPGGERDAPETGQKAAPKTQRKARFPSLVRAFRTGRPVEGTILSVIKGGYEVKVGRARGFSITLRTVTRLARGRFWTS